MHDHVDLPSNEILNSLKKETVFIPWLLLLKHQRYTGILTKEIIWAILEGVGKKSWLFRKTQEFAM